MTNSNVELIINERGFWSGITADTDRHAHDNQLSDALVKFFKNQNTNSIVDLGAGLGKYTKNFRDNGLNADCYDGNPDTTSLSEGRCAVLDLSESINIPKYDWVLSLEVGEHLPKQYEDIFINNLISSSTSGIVMSWAIPGQTGDGHFNEQSNDYIKSKMASLGYINNIEAENALREESSFSYFKNTIMVFEPDF